MVGNAKVVDASRNGKNKKCHIHSLHTQSQNLEMEISRIMIRSILLKVPWDSIWLHVVESRSRNVFSNIISQPQI